MRGPPCCLLNGGLPPINSSRKGQEVALHTWSVGEPTAETAEPTQWEALFMNTQHEARVLYSVTHARTCTCTCTYIPIYVHVHIYPGSNTQAQ